MVCRRGQGPPGCGESQGGGLGIKVGPQKADTGESTKDGAMGLGLGMIKLTWGADSGGFWSGPVGDVPWVTGTLVLWKSVLYFFVVCVCVGEHQNHRLARDWIDIAMDTSYNCTCGKFCASTLDGSNMFKQLQVLL